MKAIKIDATNRTVTEIEIDGSDTLSAMQAVVGGLIQVACELPNADAVFVDEEGLCKGKQTWFYFEGNCQPNVGDAIVCGTSIEGDTVDVKTSLEEIRAKVRFLDMEGVIALAEELGC